MSSFQLTPNPDSNSHPVASSAVKKNINEFSRLTTIPIPPAGSDQFQSKETQLLSSQPQFGALPKTFGTKNPENKKLLWGWTLRYGSPLLALAAGLVSGPCACFVVPLSFVGLFFTERKGTKILKQIRKNRLQGLPKHVHGMQDIWEKTNKKKVLSEGKKPYQELQTHYNAAVKEGLTIFFPKNKRRQQRIQRRLLLRKNSRLNKLLERMFYVQVLYRDRRVGRFIGWVRRLGSKPILRFPIFRYPIWAISWTLQLVLTLFSSKQAKVLMKQAARRV